MPRRRSVRTVTRYVRSRARRRVSRARKSVSKRNGGFLGRSLKNYGIGALGLNVISNTSMVKTAAQSVPVKYRGAAVVSGSGLIMSYAGLGQKDLVSAGGKIALATFLSGKLPGLGGSGAKNNTPPVV